MAGTRHRQLAAIRKNGEPAVLTVQVNACESLDVQDERAMDTYKTCWIELRFQIAHRLLLAQMLAADGERQVIVLRFHIVDALDRQHVYAAFMTDQDAFERLARRTRRHRKLGRRR